jgi:hypothetical protein
VEFVVKIDEAALKAMGDPVDEDKLRDDIEEALQDSGFENVLLSVQVKE